MAKSKNRIKKNDDGTVTITTTQEITVRLRPENLPKALVEGMIDEATNPMSWVDGYTYNGWRHQYGGKMIDAVYELVIKPMLQERKKAERALDAITRKYKGVARG